MQKILLVDDNHELLKVLDFLLKIYGYDVVTVNNEEMLTIELDQNNSHLILLDIMLNDKDGRQLCKKIKTNTETKNTPVILMSSNPQKLAGYKLYFANDKLEKPFGIKQLLAKVTGLLNQQIPGFSE